MDDIDHYATAPTEDMQHVSSEGYASVIGNITIASGIWSYASWAFNGDTSPVVIANGKPSRRVGFTRDGKRYEFCTCGAVYDDTGTCVWCSGLDELCPIHEGLGEDATMNCPHCGRSLTRLCSECQTTHIPLTPDEVKASNMLQCLECNAVFVVSVEQVVHLTSRVLESEV